MGLQAKALKFGWQSDMHGVVLRGGIERLPERAPDERAWKNYLRDHYKTLLAADTMCDVYYKGPSHYMDVPERGNPKGQPQLYEQARQPLWQSANRAFGPLAQQAELPEALTPHMLRHEANVMRSVLTAFRNVRRNLKEAGKREALMCEYLKDTPDVTPHAARLAELELMKNLGWLSHAVGDASVPFHTTKNGDWPLEPALNPTERMQYKQGIHGFTEAEVFTQNARQGLTQQALQAGPIQPEAYKTDEKMFTRTIGREVVQTHQLLPSVLAAHQAALQGSALNRPMLKKSLQTLLGPNVANAQEQLARLFYAAWNNAGRPAVR